MHCIYSCCSRCYTHAHPSADLLFSCYVFSQLLVSIVSGEASRDGTWQDHICLACISNKPVLIVAHQKKAELLKIFGVGMWVAINVIVWQNPNQGWSLLYLLYWHLWPAVLILYFSAYYKVWVFTSVHYNLVNRSSAFSALVKQSSLVSSEDKVIKGVVSERSSGQDLKNWAIKFWSWSQVLVYSEYS